MDLSISLQNTVINIRVAALVKTRNGFLFEKSKHDYIYVMGGRQMVGESSKEAVVREVFEEIGMRAEKVNVISVIENFFTTETEKVQEICFVYEVEDEFMGKIPPGFIEVPIGEVDKYNIKPTRMADILKDIKGSFKHFVIK